MCVCTYASPAGGSTNNSSAVVCKPVKSLHDRSYYIHPYLYTYKHMYIHIHMYMYIYIYNIYSSGAVCQPAKSLHGIAILQPMLHT